MSQQWHYSQNGAQYGPVDEAEIIRLIKSGELAPGTAVLKEGGSDWQPARNHNCFQVEIYPKTQSTTPAMNKCPCDQCGKNLKYPLEYEGMEIACPHCGQATLLTKPQGKPTSSLAPPPMASPGRATAVPPARSQAVPPAADPLADAAPRDLQQSVPAAPAAGRAEPDPFTCEFCGAPMEPEEKVCVECGERRPIVRNWNGTKIFRVVLGILLAFELLVLGLQWTTRGKPFGLRDHERHAVLVKLGLREEVDPADVKASGTNAQKATVPGAKDPDLVLADHAMKPDPDNLSLFYIRGIVKNISRYHYLGVKVKFNLKDASGSIIPGATVSDYVQTIEAGKQWQFEVLVLDPEAASCEPILPVEGYR